MESFFQFIKTNLPWIIEYKYLFLFLGAFIEGFNLMVLGGFLASVGVVKILPLFLLLLLGHTLNGYFWYGVGFWGGAKSLDRWGHRRKFSRELIERVTNYFNLYSAKAIMITKFTFGLEIAVLIMAGSLKYKFKDFSKYNFYGSLGWTLITFSIGYLFGEGFQVFRIFIKNLTYFLIFIVGAVISALILKFIIKATFIKSLEIEEKITKLNELIKNKFLKK